MHQEILWHNETIGKKVVAALEKNRFTAEYIPDRATALTRLLEIIPADASIGCGGSQTAVEIGLFKALAERGNELIDWHAPGLNTEQQLDARRRMILSDVFITSTNAVTLDGQLVNTDGTGNRVAAMAFGPKKTIVIASINKVVADIDAAITRIETLAAPMNSRRRGKPNPCTVTGLCMDCEAPTRICNVTAITHKKPTLNDMTVLIIGENLGF